jgi:carbonic anhydrase
MKILVCRKFYFLYNLLTGKKYMRPPKAKIYLMIILLLTANNFAQTEVELLKQKLVDGNKRFAASQVTHPNSSAARREEIAKGQHPFAIIVSCSDSRVPPEILFDQGLGDLFVIRAAGNVVDDFGIASIEYAVEHLGVKLVVVLGHERCGAVSAAVQGGELPGHLPKLIEAITPAVNTAKKMKGDLVANSINQNVHDVVELLKNSKPILNEVIHKHELEIAGAFYDLDDGTVKFLE